MIGTGSYSGISQNPYATFLISGRTYENDTFSFETSFTTSQSNYISSVFGVENFAKDRTEVPLFVEERYSTMLNYGYNQGYIRGLNANNFISLGEARDTTNTDTIGFYLERYQTPSSPWVVSELRGYLVYKLFRVYTIPDGNAANREVKVSIANISFNNGTFDLIVRDFYDTDANPTVIEKFTNCTLDATNNSYVAKKVGSIDGEYAILSKYIMLEMSEEAPLDALPCGFEGFITRSYTNGTSPFPIYKTHYYIPGEQISNPPFGSDTGADNALVSPGDNVRRTYLGISSSIGIDADFYDYKGKQPGTLCAEGNYSNWPNTTKGFHMDSGATVVTVSGVTQFEVGDGSFSTEPTDSTNPYYFLYSRKFSFLVQGGFDGWDIYDERRTNDDSYALGQTKFKAGYCPQAPYPTSTGWGSFKIITIEDGTIDYGNTDYYAYLLGIRTFANPEVTNINVLVTPGIDYVNNSGLVEASIDMITNERADSIYVCTTPDFNLLQNSTSMDNLIYPQEAVDSL
jgi:hypothetical protein